MAGTGAHQSCWVYLQDSWAKHLQKSVKAKFSASDSSQFQQVLGDQMERETMSSTMAANGSLRRETVPFLIPMLAGANEQVTEIKGNHFLRCFLLEFSLFPPRCL